MTARTYALMVCVALLCGTPVRAHEIGTTHVSVLVRDGGTYDVEVVTDAAALIEKLDASGDLSPSDLPPSRLQSLLTGFDAAFRKRVKISFDGSEVDPAIAYSFAPGTDVSSAAVATIRLSGLIPSGSRQFTWSYAWTFAGAKEPGLR